MRSRINLNADLGESFGVYSLANDDALLRWVPTVNIACGFHAGDSSVMRQTVQSAVDRSVDIGAHVGLPDLVGFGRRRMAITPEQLTDYVLNQLGALHAFVRRSGGKMVHVKPHGSMFGMCSEEEEYAEALLDAVTAFDRELILILAGNMIDRLAAKHGVVVLHEGYCDLAYRADGTDIVEPKKKAWDPEEAARRALRLVEFGTATSVDGQDIQVRADTICIHGDAPNAGEVVKAVVSMLTSRGVSVVGLQDIVREARGGNGIRQRNQA